MKNILIKTLAVLSVTAYTYSACATQTYKDGYFLIMILSGLIILWIAYSNRNRVVNCDSVI